MELESRLIKSENRFYAQYLLPRVIGNITNEQIATLYETYPGADPGFQARGGAFKEIAPSGGRREKFWGISCEKSRFYAKKSYFFQF